MVRATPIARGGLEASSRPATRRRALTRRSGQRARADVGFALGSTVPVHDRRHDDSLVVLPSTCIMFYTLGNSFSRSVEYCHLGDPNRGSADAGRDGPA